MDQALQGFQDFLQTQKAVSNNTIQSYLADVQRFLQYLDRIQIQNPSLATEQHIQGYLSELELLGKSVATLSRNCASVRCYYQYLIFLGRAKTNPAKAIKNKKSEHKLPSTLTGQEIDLLLAQPDRSDAKGARDKAMMELLYATGIRVSELLAVDIKDLNIKRGILHCNNGKTNRVIPIYPAAVQSVSDYLMRVRPLLVGPSDCGALFVNMNGNRMTRQGFWKIIKGYAQAAHIKKEITPHTLRHSFALHLMENGADRKDIQEMMGYVDIASTQVYADILDNRYKNVYNKCHPKARAVR